MLSGNMIKVQCNHSYILYPVNVSYPMDNIMHKMENVFVEVCPTFFIPVLIYVCLMYDEINIISFLS